MNLVNACPTMRSHTRQFLQRRLHTSFNDDLNEDNLNEDEDDLLQISLTQCLCLLVPGT